MGLFRKKKESILEPKPLDQEDIAKFLDTYLKDESRLIKDDKGLYTTLDNVNEALGPYAETIGKSHDPTKASSDTFRIIDDLLRERIKRSELIGNERRFYVS